MNNSLNGRVVAVTGASSGFGLAIAEQLCELLGGSLRLENARMPEWAREEALRRSSGGRGPDGVRARMLLPRHVGRVGR